LKRYKVVSLFSGAMGLDIGLDRTGRFELLACVEVERAFCDTIRANVAACRIAGNPIVLERDIANLSVAEFTASTGIKPGDVDVLVGGPPCQAFSTAGNRGTVLDPRGTLLWTSCASWRVCGHVSS
jgi:DNA (cytosine-5)-methyltransferase 1